MFIIGGALPIEKGTNDSWCLHCTICMLPLSGCRLQTSRNQTKSALIQNPVLFAETESAWMQNRNVGRIHMAGLSHRSRSDDAAEPKFQIPKTDQNHGVKQSHNWYITLTILIVCCKQRKTTKKIQQKLKTAICVVQAFTRSAHTWTNAVEALKSPAGQTF